MIAIAGAESSFNTDAKGPTLGCGRGAEGLWQINMCVHSCADVLQPVANAKCAKRIRNSQGLNAWEVYKTGAYKRFIPQATQGYQAWLNEVKQRGAGEGVDDRSEKILRAEGGSTTGAPGGVIPNPIEGVQDAAGAITGAISAIVEFLNRIGAWVSDSDNWVRVGKVVGGVTLVIVGASVVAKDPVVKAVAKNVPVGKAIKVVKR